MLSVKPSEVASPEPHDSEPEPKDETIILARLSEADRKLVRGLRAGDNGAFTQLDEQYRQRLIDVATKVSGKHEDALEIVQETFIVVLRRIKGFKGQSTIYTWMYRILLKLCGNRVRSKNNQTKLALELSRTQAEDGSNLRPDVRLNSKRAIQVLQESLEELSSEHRAAITLGVFGGLSHGAIAKKLKIPEGTARSRLHNARIHLETILSTKGLMDK